MDIDRAPKKYRKNFLGRGRTMGKPNALSLVKALASKISPDELHNSQRDNLFISNSKSKVCNLAFFVVCFKFFLSFGFV